MTQRTQHTLLARLLQRDTVKTLSMTEPWGTLVARGAKQMETRSWSTAYRGPVAIHCARRMPEDLNALCQLPYFCEALPSNARNEQLPLDQRFPRGKVIAIALLDEVQPTECVQPNAQERAFGNYAPGRYAWIFSTVYQLRTPQPVRGTLGLWTWHPLPAFWEEIQAELDAEVRK
jgi:activating signal cointegrator 1